MYDQGAHGIRSGSTIHARPRARESQRIAIVMSRLAHNVSAQRTRIRRYSAHVVLQPDTTELHAHHTGHFEFECLAMHKRLDARCVALEVREPPSGFRQDVKILNCRV